MGQNKLVLEELQSKPALTRGYSVGDYNQIIKGDQWIRLSEGCPNNCEYCAETKVNGSKPIYYEIPEITKNKVKIIDMNLTYKPKFIEYITKLGEIKVNGKKVVYELVCGIDYRYMTQEKADALKKNGFKQIRLAWDYGYHLAYKIKDCIDMLLKSGYKSKEIQVFMIANYKVNPREFIRKIHSLAFWNVQVSDCWFDNQKKGNVKPIWWDHKEIEFIGSLCRDHNIMCRHNGFQVEKIKTHNMGDNSK